MSPLTWRLTPERVVPAAILVAAVAVVLFGARPQAGSWNDGSRLATVEALVDYHTWAIDRSIFVAVPPDRTNGSPYPEEDTALCSGGTRDKLFIRGRYYSDKPPVPALCMAGIYQLWQWCGGASARESPHCFCYTQTVLTSGLAYILAVWCVYWTGAALGLPVRTSLLLTASFSLTTVALPYTRQVNGHILLLAVVAALMLSLAHLAKDAVPAPIPWRRLCWVGTLGGLGYTIDLGVGPVILACLSVLIGYRCRRSKSVAILLLAAAPWLVLHHALTYQIGGTLLPSNAKPEYLAWPGSPFSRQNMTGLCNHSPVDLVVYGLALILGKRGFIGHSLALILAVPGLFALRKQRLTEWPELCFAVAGCVGTWLLYTAFSNNYSGPCCSIRWFVPLLAPAYFVLAVCLRQFPDWSWDLAVLSAWGAVLAAIMWWHGPWMMHLVPGFWPVQLAALLCWYACRQWRQRVKQRSATGNSRLGARASFAIRPVAHAASAAHRFGMRNGDEHGPNALDGSLAGHAALPARHPPAPVP